MSSERLKAYFISEARDYLDEIDQLLAGDGAPDGKRLVRLATGVRGSMDMAGAERISEVASRLEDAARALMESKLSWSDELRELARQTSLDVRRLAAAVGNWGREQEEQVQMSISRWDNFGAAPGERPVVSIEELFFDDAGPHILFDGTVAARPTVRIDGLLLRGESALRAALSLRPAFEALARGESGPRSAPDLVAELFDLLDLSLTAEVQEA